MASTNSDNFQILHNMSTETLEGLIMKREINKFEHLLRMNDDSLTKKNYKILRQENIITWILRELLEDDDRKRL